MDRWGSFSQKQPVGVAGIQTRLSGKVSIHRISWPGHHGEKKMQLSENFIGMPHPEGCLEALLHF